MMAQAIHFVVFLRHIQESHVVWSAVCADGKNLLLLTNKDTLDLGSGGAEEVIQLYCNEGKRCNNTFKMFRARNAFVSCACELFVLFSVAFWLVSSADIWIHVLYPVNTQNMVTSRIDMAVREFYDSEYLLAWIKWTDHIVVVTAVVVI
jgi:hypothetical protein